MRKRRIASLLTGTLIAAHVGGCLFVAEEKKPDTTVTTTLPPKPDVPMSEDYIRSKPGDMLAFMPQGWFLIDVDGKTSSDVVAVAVNADYTLSMVVQSIRKNDLIEQTVNKEGVLGLARLAFEKRSRKTANAVRLLSTFSTTVIGNKTFGVYEFCGESADTTAGILRSRSAVFISSIKNYYEVSLVPTNAVSLKPIPDETESANIFRSILATLQY